MVLRHVNAVIVGAGAGGGVVAKELSEAGLTVVLLERGGWVGFDRHDHDELTSQRTQVLSAAFGPDRRSPRVVEVAPGSFKTVYPAGGQYGNNAACVGSGTVCYGAMAWRFDPKDFRMRSTYGRPEGSTLEDWPISYDDLEPFYEKAEWEIGVAGDMSGNPFCGPRRKPYPMPAFPYNLEGRLLAASAQRLGWHPFPIPMLRNSVPYRGRQACIGCRYCVGFACEIDAKGGTQNTVIPSALATGNCELRTGVIASEVVIDDGGRARGVKYFDANGRGQYQTSDLVVVSGGAIETARLLLNSKSKLFPQGAGNRHDWVGRNLQGHAYFNATGIFDVDTYDDVGAGATIGISDFNHDNPGLRGGALLANEFIRPPYIFSRIRPPGGARWGRDYKKFQRQYYHRSIQLAGPVQEMPVFDARVQVDPVVKDHWGIPVARLSGYTHPDDATTAAALAARAEQWLRATGAVRVWTGLPPAKRAARAGQHQAGTCRMGHDPTLSVTDPTGRVHEVDNLYLADGSLHVTNGGFNPVLTIMALGYWVGHHILKSRSGGGGA